jgi:hypothetical protein
MSPENELRTVPLQVGCIRWLLKGKCHRCTCLKPPRADHQEACVDRQHRRVLTIRPYVASMRASVKQRALDFEAIRIESELFAEQHGLSVRVSDVNREHPGWSVLVEYRRGNA